MKFADQEIFTESGSPIQDVYAPKVLPDGSIEVVVIGQEDFDAYIQSFKESTDISFILAKLAQGDDSALHARPGMYGDFTRVPGSFAEVLQLQIDANRAFDRLPLDIKKKFDNDVNKFLGSAGSESWLENMDGVLSDEIKALYTKVVPEQKESEVTE